VQILEQARVIEEKRKAEHAAAAQAAAAAAAAAKKNAVPVAPKPPPPAEEVPFNPGDLIYPQVLCSSAAEGAGWSGIGLASVLQLQCLLPCYSATRPCTPCRMADVVVFVSCD
jgi:pyruvate/2-oxoglutarate dehydrogenase complex dihydrolipoamide acyltransferase (E2) component